MIETLVIQMLVWNGPHPLPIQHVQVIRDHGAYNRTVCLDIARRFRKNWEHRADIIYIGCPDHWRET